MRLAIGATLLSILVAVGLLIWRQSPPPSGAPYTLPTVGDVSHFNARAAQTSVLTIEAATDISFMRPFIDEFQTRHPHIAVHYVDYLSSDLLARADRACAGKDLTPDLYVSVSTDHLVQLANNGCSAAVPKSIAEQAPSWARWRRDVMAFAVEPAVIVFDQRALDRAHVPTTHLAFIEEMRAASDLWRGKIGTYDIEQSGSGYNYAAFDARQSATYGRLIESFGRIQARTYCCSNVMVDEVDRGEILLAYNVQLSYAVAAQRAGKRIGVIFPSDYQAVQTRSVMTTRDARNRQDALTFIEYLLSPRGQAMARELVTPPPGAVTVGQVMEVERMGQVSVDPTLLVLRDQARRERFVAEWAQAVRPSLAAVPVFPK